MGSFFSVIPVVVRRVSANARLLLAVIIGAVLAAALMSTTSIYTDAIRDLGLDHAIREQGPDKINVAIRASSHPSAKETIDSDNQFVDQTVRDNIGPLVNGTITHVARSETFYVAQPGQTVPAIVPAAQVRGFFQFASDLEPHINVTDGKTPAAARLTTGAPSMEVAIGKATADRLGLKVGDKFDLFFYNALQKEPVHVTISALVEPKDPKEQYWLGQTDFFNFPSSGWDTLAFFIDEQTYFDTIVPYLPNMTSDISWFVYLKTGSLNARNANPAHDSLGRVKTQLEGQIARTTMATQLPTVLETFDEKLFFTRIPLLVLVLQIAGIVLYYLFMVSTMLVERQAGEIALLKSRGATTAQVMQIYIIEGLGIFGIALVLGPPLAAILVSLLGYAPPFHDLSGGSTLDVHLTLTAYAWAVSGALLAFATLLGPAYFATRKTVVQQRTASARPPTQPFFTKYYLDLVLVGIGAVLFFQLDRRGTLVTNDFFGKQSVDPVSLLTPTFFILTVGIVFLRLFPLVLRLLAWGVARAQGTSVLIGMWQLVRNPTHYSRLVLLLMLATAVGMFAASFGATLNRSYADRASYESGASLRLTSLHKSAGTGPSDIEQAVQQQTGAQAASNVLRNTGSTGPTIGRVSVDVLGVNPESFDDVAYFRGDFADKTLPELLSELAADPPLQKGLAIPAGTRWLGLWVNPVDLNGAPGLDIRVRDATGRYFAYNFGPDVPTTGAFVIPASQQRDLPKGWSFIIADMSKPQLVAGAQNLGYTSTAPVEPLTIVDLAVRFQTRVSALNGNVQVDDIQASTDATLPGNLATDKVFIDPNKSTVPFAQSTMLLDFNDVSNWEPIQGINAIKLNDTLTQIPSAGGNVGSIRWTQVQGQPQTHGIRPKIGDKPLAAIVSEGYLLKMNAKVGDVMNVFVGSSFIDMQVVGVYKMFPTLKDPRKEASLVVNNTRLLELMNSNPRSSATYPDEVWLKANAEASAQTQSELDDGTLQGTLVSFQTLRTAQQKDPLIAAGWEGILFLSFAAILLLSAIGFLIYSYLTAQKRTLEFAVLRTMGFSKRQIATVVGFEQLFVIGLGMIAGTLMGLRLGSLMIKYMGLTETGDEVLPPMALHVSWLTIGAAWLVLALVFLVTIGFVVLLYSRLALHKVLRIGET